MQAHSAMACGRDEAARMPTMPPRSPTGQPESHDWFASAPGRAVLDSEADCIRAALAERPGQPWLWLAPAPPPGDIAGHGLPLQARGDGWSGAIRCSLPLPLANESVASVVLQHAVRSGRDVPLLDECARVLVPGGRLWLFLLNPLSAYRWRWGESGLGASEPMPWRRRLRTAGLHPDPISQGLGPRWRVEIAPALQQGPGLRAAYVMRAEKRTIPLTPVRARAALRIGKGVPAA
jgi:SAM-dependent methyltransferase